MKREIKFRAWNTEMNHMVLPSLKFGREIWPCTYKRIIKSETKENGDTVELVLEMVSVDHILQSPEFEVMQFTGLLDKSGKEVYESDKVVYTLNHDSSQKEIEAVVEWHNHAWRLNRIWLLTEIRNIKVVGNVHEAVS
jgi:uncharacterized phage protein (TIGR01671 family)